MKEYVLPDLPYDYAGLEPHISAEIMRLHHDKHHQAYVNGANQALAGLQEARQKGDLAKVAALEHLLAFNVSGHVLHSLFWQNMAPKGGGQPEGALAQQIKTDFGSFDAFKAQMTRAAATITGSGWAALNWDPAGGQLVVVQLHDHQSETTQGSLPLMVLDAWEHAYYLQYKNEKAKFFEAVWNVWNWEDIGARFDAVRRLDLGLSRVAA